MESFRECGWAAYAALGAGILVTLFGAVAFGLALLKPRTGVIAGIAALAMSLAPGGVGLLGMFWGRHQTDSILASGVISPDRVDEIRAMGYQEAGQCVPVGMSIGALPFVMAGAAIAVGVVKKSGEKKS
jgi:hypothetical protein